MYQAVIVDDEPVIVSGIRDALDWEGFGFEIALATTSPATVLSFLCIFSLPTSPCPKWTALR